jgi:hypothetical protein
MFLTTEALVVEIAEEKKTTRRHEGAQMDDY